MKGTRNSGTILAGKDIANPTAFICASLDALRYLHLDTYADLISHALYKVLIDTFPIFVHSFRISQFWKSREFLKSVL